MFYVVLVVRSDFETKSVHVSIANPVALSKSGRSYGVPLGT